ncbi:MAG: PQQ-dependent sugar dehydrogenase [Phycisphaerales bacterium]
MQYVVQRVVGMLAAMVMLSVVAPPAALGQHAGGGNQVLKGTPAGRQLTGEGARDVLGFSVRAGYELTLAADEVSGGRFLEFDERGRLYVSVPSGEIVQLFDDDGDGVFERRREVVTGLRGLHGLCFRKDDTGSWLWFTTSDSVRRVRVDTLPEQGEVKGTVETILKPGDLPRGGGHWWRSVLVTETHVFTSIGDSGNISDETASERQKVWRFNHDGTGKTLWASGVRNNEKLRLRPGTSEVWGVDHGSDNMGAPLGESARAYGPVTDMNPPDEFNHYIEGGFYGHPFVTGNRVPRYEFAVGKGKREDLVELADTTIPPMWCFQAHSSSNAFAFLEPGLCGAGKAMPADHAGDAFVAQRGSWNRRAPSGHTISRVLFDDGVPYGQLVIVSTLAKGGRSHNGKPIDCVQAADGSVLFSVDSMQETNAARVYRLRWVGEGASSK